MTATRTWTAVCALVLLALVPDATAQTRACRAKSRQAPHRVGDSRSVFAPAGAGGDNSLRTAVHTRRIIDPILGAKLTGSVGRVTFGTLSASDEAQGRALAEGDPNHDKQTLFISVPFLTPLTGRPQRQRDTEVRTSGDLAIC